MTDVSNYGTTYSKYFYGTKLFYDLGPLEIESSGGALSLNSSDNPINVGNAAVSQPINIGTAGQRIITIGNSTGTTALVMDAGAGGFSLDAAGASNMTTSAGKLTIQGATGEDVGTSGQTTTFKGAATVDQILTVTGNADLNATLDVAGQVDLAAPGVTTTVRGLLIADQAATIAGNLQVNANANVTGLVTLGSTQNDVTIAGNLVVLGELQGADLGNGVFDELQINGPSDLNGVLDVSGQVDLGAFGGAADTTVRGDLLVDEELTVTGAADLNGTLDVAGQVDLGASGGVADTTVRGSLIVQEDVTINGNLSVIGNVTSIASETVIIDDNLVVVNSGPSGTKDGGVLVQRWQTENSAGDGDVVSDPAFDSGTAQGVTSTSITLKTLSNGTNDFYNNMYVLITSATTGANQVRKIQDYVGSTKIATVTAWDTTPTGTVTYSLHNKPYVGSLYDESADVWSFVAVLGDPGNTVVTIQEYINIRAGAAQFDGLVDLNGSLDADLTTFSVDTTSNASGAISLNTNGGTSETIEITNGQGTGNSSINISSTSGGVNIAGSKVGVVGDLNVEPSGNLASSASSYHLYFGEKGSEGSWRLGITSDNLFELSRHDGASYQIKAKIG